MINFDRTLDQWITIADAASIQNIFDGGGSISFTGFLSGYGDSNAGVIATKNFDTGWRVQVSNLGQMRLHVDHDTTDGVWWMPTLQNQFRHWAITYDADSNANDPVMYLDGVSQTVTELTTPSGTRLSDVGEDLIIGGRTDGTLGMSMNLGDLRLFDRILTPGEVRAMAQTMGRAAVAPAVVRLPMNEFKSQVSTGVAADSIRDNSGHANHGAFNIAAEYAGGGPFPNPGGSTGRGGARGLMR